ncbi:MAG: tetratricopeptide repeat protein [Chloroflexota bacterium]
MFRYPLRLIFPLGFILLCFTAYQHTAPILAQQNTPTATPETSPTSTPIPTEVLNDILTQGQNLFYQGYYPDAFLIFQSVINSTGESSDRHSQALFWMGRCQIALNRFSDAEVIFKTYVDRFPNNSLTPVAYYHLALVLEQTGDYESTLSAYQDSITPNSPIAAYIYERMGDLALNRNRPREAVKWYLAGLNSTEDVAFQVHLREGVAEAFLAQNQISPALDQYDAILTVSRIPAYRAKITRLKGEAFLQKGELDAAQRAFQTALDRYPDTLDAYLGLIEMVNRDMPVDEFQRGYTDYYGGNAYQPAINALRRYLDTDPKTRADEALWIIALSYRALGEYQQAIDTFQRLIDIYPDSGYRDDAHLQIARTFGWQGNTNIAISRYLALAETHQTPSVRSEALWRAAILEARAGLFEQAHDHYLEFAQRYPYHDSAADALFRSGFMAYQNEDFQTAETRWAERLNRYPTADNTAEANFWYIKSLLALNRTDKARPLLTALSEQSLHYYSQRAADILLEINPRTAPVPTAVLNFESSSRNDQQAAEFWLANQLRLTTNIPLAKPSLYILGDENFIRGEMLQQYGLLQEAEDAFDQVRQTWRNNPVALYQLALLFQEKRQYRLSILSAQRLATLVQATSSADTPIFIRRLIYPAYYQDLVIPQAERFNVEPALVFSLMRQESLFESQAQSYANARGLMQIIPLTGQDIADRLGDDDYTLDTLWLPHQNVEFGISYIRQMLNFLDEDRYAALAAYNAGPGNVQSWLPFPEDFDLFVSQIPLSEPQIYVRNIYLNLAHYRAIYQGN